jgi:hypothetical protein
LREGGWKRAEGEWKKSRRKKVGREKRHTHGVETKTARLTTAEGERREALAAKRKDRKERGWEVLFSERQRGRGVGDEMGMSEVKGSG